MEPLASAWGSQHSSIRNIEARDEDVPQSTIGSVGASFREVRRLPVGVREEFPLE